MTVTMVAAILLNTIVTKSVSQIVNMNLSANQHENINRTVIITNSETAVNDGAMKDRTEMNKGVMKGIDSTCLFTRKAESASLVRRLNPE